MTDTALVAVLLATAAGALAGGAWVAGRRKAGERQRPGAAVALADNGGGYIGRDAAAAVVTILSL